MAVAARSSTSEAERGAPLGEEPAGGPWHVSLRASAGAGAHAAREPVRQPPHIQYEDPNKAVSVMGGGACEWPSGADSGATCPSAEQWH